MNLSSIVRRAVLGTVLALTGAVLAAGAAGAQQTGVATPGQTSIVTDKDAYVVGEPITITYILPGPGRIRITDLQAGKVSTLRAGYTYQVTGRIAGTVTPPAGKECLKLEYTDSRNQKSAAETCFEVKDKEPEQMLAPGLYTLRNRETGLMLDSNLEKKVYPHAPNDGAFQKWMLESGPDGFFYLRDLATSYYLDSNLAGQIYTQEKNLGQFQQWLPAPVAEGHFVLRNRATGRALGSTSMSIYSESSPEGMQGHWQLTAVQP